MSRYSWNVSCILLSFIAGSSLLHKDLCLGAKLERKQDFFDVESFDNKREYGLSEIGKRGFSTLGFDYSTSSEYGLGARTIVNSDYSHGRSGSSDEGPSSSPARDLIPPPPFSSSTSPPSPIRSEYPKFGRISSASSPPTKDFPPSYLHHLHYPHHHRSQISRRSPPHHPHIVQHHHHHQPSLSHYLEEISSSIPIPGGGPRGRGRNPGNFGLVADNDGKLIGYRGSILPGFGETQSIVSTSSSPDPANFIGSYFPEFSKPKFRNLASSASSGSYTSTPVYYPGREEDHTYRMRDTTSQGYEDEEHGPSSEDTDFTVGSSGGTYQPSPLPQPPPPPPPHHYHLRESDAVLGHGHGHNYIKGTSRYLPYTREHNHHAPPPQPPPGFSYGHSPLGKNHRLASYDYTGKRSYSGPASNSPSGYDVHTTNSVERGESTPSYGYVGLSYNDYGSS